MSTKPVPTPTPESQPFWYAARHGELWMQRCVTTGSLIYPPRNSSPFVAGGEIEWVQVSGRAKLHSYVINHRPAPGFEQDAPYAIAVVELTEGPRMMTNIVGIENTPENLILDMPLKVQFEFRGAFPIPVFAPVDEEQRWGKGVRAS